MKLILHIIAKDLRRLRGWLVAWLVVLALPVLLGLKALGAEPAPNEWSLQRELAVAATRTSHGTQTSCRCNADVSRHPNNHHRPPELSLQRGRIDATADASRRSVRGGPERRPPDPPRPAVTPGTNRRCAPRSY